ncbi:MAG: hypothetical protein AseanaTS_14220 [Candidatus Pelagadaptatus aseana]|uniref:Fis family transcriptional regulator n=1 Tax=Candidatus Pelagadaptatus aseana TaxID=3120508 RepID=UPI0039B1637E
MTTKTQKKIDNNIIRVLNQVCDQSLEDVAGFQWLTHQANYTNFPASLLITCVFDTEANRVHQIEAGGCKVLLQRIQSGLLKVGVKFKSLPQQVLFDSEEACEQQHEGDWSVRLASRSGRAVARNRPA